MTFASMTPGQRPEMPEEDLRPRACEERRDRMTAIAEIHKRMETADVAEAIASMGAEFIRAQLARPSVLGDLFRPWPSLPYVLMDGGEDLTHWVGDLGGFAARACDGERSQVAFARVEPGSVPTCLRCSVITRTA